VVAQESARLGEELGKLAPYGGPDQQLRVPKLAKAADVVLVQVRQDRRADVARRVPECGVVGAAFDRASNHVAL